MCVKLFLTGLSKTKLVPNFEQSHASLGFQNQHSNGSAGDSLQVNINLSQRPLILTYFISRQLLFLLANPCLSFNWHVLYMINKAKCFLIHEVLMIKAFLGCYLFDRNAFRAIKSSSTASGCQLAPLEPLDLKSVYRWHKLTS